jgi:hypothetical protein
VTLQGTVFGELLPAEGAAQRTELSHRVGDARASISDLRASNRELGLDLVDQVAWKLHASPAVRVANSHSNGFLWGIGRAGRNLTRAEWQGFLRTVRTARPAAKASPCCRQSAAAADHAKVTFAAKP